MYCGNCGYKMPDGAAFCPECGAPADGRQPAGQTQPCVTAPAAEAPQMSIVKKYFGGDTAVVACSLLTAALAVKAIGSNGEALLSVGSILLLIGSWLICSTCRRRDVPVRSGGFGVVRADAILSIVCLALCIFAGIVCLAFCFAGGSVLSRAIDKSGLGSLFAMSEVAASELLIIFCTALVVVSAVSVVLASFVYRFTDSLHRLSKGTTDALRYAKFTEIILYILGIASAVSSFSTLYFNRSLGSAYRTDAPLMILGSLLGGAALILFAVLIGRVNRDSASARTAIPPVQYGAPQGGETPSDGTPKYPSPQ